MARFRVGRGGAVLAICLGFTREEVALAEAGGQAFRLEYWAQGHCPDAAEFARQVQTRAPRLRPAVSDEPALGFYAELVEENGSAIGRLTARSPDGREVRREVRGPTCDDVSTALALIAAMAVDPTQPVAAAARPPARPPAASSRVKRADEAADADLLALQAPPPLRPQRWTFGLGGGLGFDSTIAPSPGYGLSIAFEAEGRQGSVVRPLFALTANRAAAPNTETRAGNSASFTWLAFRMAACPLRWPEDTPLFIRPCAFFDAGLLGANVSQGANNQDRSKTWLAVGGFGRVEALVAEEVLSFQLDGGITVPLERNSFDAGGDSPSAFRVPRSGILGRIGLSYRFQ